jgi:hypothetical protein
LDTELDLDLDLDLTVDQEAEDVLYMQDINQVKIEKFHLIRQGKELLLVF